MKLSRHFTDTEFECGDGCGLKSPHPVLIHALEMTRYGAGELPLHVNSGCRCVAHNAAIGGNPASFHLPTYVEGLCRAADIRERTKARRKLICQSAMNAGVTDIGVYPWGLHLAVLTPEGLWSGRT